MTRAAPATKNQLDPPPSAALLRAIARLGWRVRWQRAARAASHAAVIASALLGPALFYAKSTRAGAALPLQLLAAGAALVTLSALVAAARVVAPLPLARAIDRASGSADLVASGWEFSHLRQADRTVFMRATVAAAEAHAERIARREVLPWRWPASAIASPWLALGIACLWNLKAPPPSAAKENAPSPPLRLLSRVELEAEHRAIRSELPADDARLRAIGERYDDLLERMEHAQIDRIAVLRALSDLDAQLRASSEHSEADTAELRALGRALAEWPPTEALGVALGHDDLAAARAALQKLADRSRPPIGAGALERLRAALRYALSKQEQRRQARMAEARRSLDLLHKRADEGSSAGAPGSRSKSGRELDELARDEAGDRGGEAPLERDLSRAADGGGEAAHTSRELDRAADRLAELQKSAAHDRALERMRSQLDELRQRLAEERSSGGRSTGEPAPSSSSDPAASPPPSAAEKPLDVSEFQRRARGSQAAPNGEAKPAEAAGETKPSAGGDEANGLLIDRNRPPSAAGADSLLGREIGPPESAPGKDGRIQHGAATKSEQASDDVAVAGAIGRGPSRRSVIYDAAAQGFGSRAYEKVHADYRDHAESELERESLPAGYRYYVHRYFELIQPNEAPHD